MSNPAFTLQRTRFAYQLRYHLGFGTHRHRPFLVGNAFQSELTRTLRDVCDHANFHLLENEIEDRWLRMLISLRPEVAPAQAVQVLKSNISRLLRLSECGSQVPDSLWARGYYLRSVGQVTTTTIQKYLADQANHHQHTSRLWARYEHPDPTPFMELRPFAHCMAEYNCHLVFCPLGHKSLIDETFADPLVEYLLHVGESRDFQILSLSVLDNHVHLFAALPPRLSPGDFAMTVMNNTSDWLWRQNPGAFRLWETTTFWEPTAYVGTAGKITSRRAAEYLRLASRQQEAC